MTIIKFKYVENGQVIEHANSGKTKFDNQVFMKVPGKKFSSLVPCSCGSDEWNAININAKGVHHVHFHSDTEVTYTPNCMPTAEHIKDALWT